MTRRDTQDIPRWAKELGQETWERINELLYEGWRPCDVMRELHIPEKKKGSLIQHGKKYRHRRILAPLLLLREQIVQGALELAPDTRTAMRIVIAEAINRDTESHRRQRATSTMLQVFELAEKIGRAAEEAEGDRKRDEDEREQKIDVNEAVRRVLERYSVDGGGSSDG